MPVAPASAQARALRGKLFARLGVMLVAFTAVFAVVAFLADTYVVPTLANEIADATAKWQYMTEDEYLALQESFQGEGASNLNVYPQDDGTYAVRNLSTYYTVRAIKYPLAIGMYLLGCVALVFSALNRSLRYFDTLSTAVTGLLADRHTSVKLPDDLSIIRAELVEIRERELASERAAVAAERRKDELVAYLAHDIKTPLTSVLGYLSLLRETPQLSSENVQEFAGVAYAKAERLEGLVDEFFEITRYNLQAIPIEREQVDIALFCRQVADEFFPEADERGITMQVSAPRDVRFFIDPDKLARALGNVVRNAVAFANEGSTVHLEAVVRSDRAVLTVTDQGREIAPAHLQSIFEKFYREDSARSTRRGGAGLGLAIAKEIVLAHGGEISATSEEGLTTFVLDVPLGSCA